MFIQLLRGTIPAVRDKDPVKLSAKVSILSSTWVPWRISYSIPSQSILRSLHRSIPWTWNTSSSVIVGMSPSTPYALISNDGARPSRVARICRHAQPAFLVHDGLRKQDDVVDTIDTEILGTVAIITGKRFEGQDLQRAIAWPSTSRTGRCVRRHRSRHRHRRSACPGRNSHPFGVPRPPIVRPVTGLVVDEQGDVIDLIVTEYTHDPTPLRTPASTSLWTTKRVSPPGPMNVNGRGSG